MAPSLRKGRCGSAGGFTLAEVSIAVLVLGIFTAICIEGIVCAQVASMKARQQNIVNDFLLHYAENIKGLPFPGTVPGANVVGSGSYINLLWNGDPTRDIGGGSLTTPSICIPPSGSTNPLTTADYLVFHPDLQWLTNANPQLQVTLTTNWVALSGAQVNHDIHVNVAVSWDAPLGYGGRLQSQLDIVRMKNL
ncbi:MAG: prepilin-type N-terminal cleavage/methylation domain-containing protein [Limisphaerales bacterium]